MKKILLCVGALSLWAMAAIAENGPLEPQLISSEHLSGPASLGLELRTYASNSDQIKLNGTLHIAFGPKNQEIVTDSHNNRFLYRASADEPFQISPIPVKGQHSLVYNPADKLYYANDTANHRIISFSDLSTSKITAETKNIAGIELKRPHDIVVDPATAWIYTINPNSGQVFRFTAIGENESVLSVPVKGYARALTFAKGKLYVIGSSRGRIVEVVDWDTEKFKIYDSFAPTKKNGPAGSWTKTGLVLNDAEFFDGFWYATSYFTKSFAKGSNFDENKFIRFKTLDDFVKGNWTDLSSLIPTGMTPYYLTVNKGKLYLAIFHHESHGNGDSILQLSPVKPSSSRVKKNQRKTSTKAAKYADSVPQPTLSEIAYGDHARHVLDFWQAPSDKPTPLVFVIHGGGWKNGSKERLNRFVDASALLQQGISVVAINYRLIRKDTDIKPPVKAPLYDAARALQFVRSKAKEWNIDKRRIAAAGASAGACSSLWLAFHKDLADPENADPIARESTRLYCAAVNNAQTSLDPKQMKQWTPNSKYGGHAFGLQNFDEFLAERDKILPWIAEYSPYALLSPDDPPVYLHYSKDSPAIGKPQKDPTHTANFGMKLQERCLELGVKCELVYPGAKKVKYKDSSAYLIATLKSPAEESGK
ncbi:carboxylesterase family protein [Lentisphaera profundi]|uniref:Carboxylesterase family protein n=1 Tax=Lentisphaera profundi TaxID=1658616 RepID=A0ABY7W1F4_9BACT|nr:carboxylesterase family protein [Lentisphaera profundi]WDE98952.1 carboxylesterase family protein [Lentisphaera profundi]